MSTQAQQYRDWLVVEALLTPSFTKTAEGGAFAAVISHIKNYVSGKIDPNHVAASIIDILTPGILSVTVSPLLGGLVRVAEIFFGFHPGKILTEAVAGLLPSLRANKPVSSEEVDAHVNQAVQADNNAPDIKKFQHASLRDAQLMCLAIESYLTTDGSITKQADLMRDMLRLARMRPVTASLLSRAISWVIKVVLASAGFMVAGDIVHSLIDGTGHMFGGSSGTSSNSEHTMSGDSPVPVHQSHQTTFSVNPNYTPSRLNISGGWIEPVPPAQIGERIIKWAQAIYPDPRLTADLIHRLPSFQGLIDTIQQYNENNTTNVTFMPKGLTSEKQVVDYFIDEAAQQVEAKTPKPIEAKS